MIEIRPGELSCISGEPGSGKTYSALCAVKQFMDVNPEARVLWIDTFARNTGTHRFRSMGFDLSRIHYSIAFKYSDVEEATRRFSDRPELIVLDDITNIADGKDEHRPRTIDFVGVTLQDIAKRYNSAVLFTVNKRRTYQGTPSKIATISYSMLMMLDNEYCIENNSKDYDGNLINEDGDLCGYKMKVRQTKNRNGEPGESEMWFDSNTGRTFSKEELIFEPHEIAA